MAEAFLDSPARSEPNDGEDDDAVDLSSPAAASAGAGKDSKKIAKLGKRKKSSLPSASPNYGSQDDEKGGQVGAEQHNKGGNEHGREDEEEEEHPEVEFGKQHTIDPERMQAILASFTPEQMSRYECYRRSGFQRANMRRLLQSVAGCPISIPMTIVMSGIAKIFVGELVEMGRIVMTERKESGPIRPRHLREAYRRLKLEGKVPSKSRRPLFH